MDFAKLLLKARTSAGLTRAQVAQTTGVPTGTLFNWEMRSMVPRNWADFAAVAAAVRLPVSSVLI